MSDKHGWTDGAIEFYLNLHTNNLQETGEAIHSVVEKNTADGLADGIKKFETNADFRQNADNRVLHTSLSGTPLENVTIYQRHAAAAVKDILNWTGNMLAHGDGGDVARLKTEYVQQLYKELFSGFNFNKDEAKRVETAINLKIDELLQFKNKHYNYEINDNDRLFATLSELGGFGAFTDSQARSIASNKALERLLTNNGKISFDSISVFDIFKYFKRVGQGNSVIDIPQYTSSVITKKQDDFKQLKFNPSEINQIKNDEEKLKYLFEKRNAILNAALSGDDLYYGHPIASKSANGRYEVTPGAKDVLENRLRNLGYGLLEIQIGEIAKRINNNEIVDRIFSSTSKWLDDGRGHFYDVNDLTKQYLAYNGNDGKYYVAPSQARTFFHNEIAKDYRISDEELSKINLADYKNMLPNVNFSDWTGRENIFHKDLHSLTKFGSMTSEYLELFKDIDIEELQTLFTALSYFTSGTADGSWKNFIAGLQDYQKYVGDNGQINAEGGANKKKITDIKRNLFPFLNFFDKDFTIPAQMISLVSDYKDINKIRGQKEGSKERELETYQLMSELVNVFKSWDAGKNGYGHRQLTPIVNGQLNGAYIVPVVDDVNEKLYSSYSARANYKNSKTTSNMHNLFTRQTVYENTDKLVSAIPYHFLGKNTQDSQLEQLVQGLIAHNLAKLAQGDFSAAHAISNKNIIGIADSILNDLKSVSGSSEGKLIEQIEHEIATAIEFSERVSAIDFQRKKYSGKIGSHTSAKESLINDALYKLKTVGGKQGSDIRSLDRVQVALLEEALLAEDNERRKYGKKLRYQKIKEMANRKDVAAHMKLAPGKITDLKKLVLSPEELLFNELMKKQAEAAKTETINQYKALLGYTNDGNGMKFKKNIESVIAGYIGMDFAKIADPTTIAGNILQRFKEHNGFINENNQRTQWDENNLGKTSQTGVKTAASSTTSIQPTPAAPIPTSSVITAKTGHMSLTAERATAVARSLKVVHDIGALIAEVDKLSHGFTTSSTSQGLSDVLLQLRTASYNIANSRKGVNNRSATTIDKFKEDIKAGKSLVDVLTSGLDDPYGYNATLRHAAIENQAMKAMRLDDIDFKNLDYKKQQEYLNASLPFTKNIKEEMSKPLADRNYTIIEQLTNQLLAAVGSVSGEFLDTPLQYKKWATIAKAESALSGASKFKSADKGYDFSNVSDTAKVTELVNNINALIVGLQQNFNNEIEEKNALSLLNNAISALNQIVNNEVSYRKTNAYMANQNYKAATLISNFETFKEGATYKAFNENGMFAGTDDATRVKDDAAAIESTTKQINDLLAITQRNEQQDEELNILIGQLENQQRAFAALIKELTARYDPAARARQIINRDAINAEASTSVEKFNLINEKFSHAAFLNGENSQYTNESKAAIEALIADTKQLVSTLIDQKTNNINGAANEDVQRTARQVDANVRTLQAIYDRGRDAERANNEKTARDITANNIRNYLNDNTQIFKDPALVSKFLDLQNKVTNVGISAGEASKQFSLLKSEVKRAGLDGISIYQRLGKLIKRHLSTFFVMRGIHAVRRAITQTYNNIVQIDTAMTELKKVTDSTDTAYNDFFDSAISKAKQFGVAITEVISATSEFAKLGYSLKDAFIMADAAIVYKNVGDGIKDVQSASQSIISTIKAFEMPVGDTMEVVDVFNEIGNKFSITSGGVGEALEKSASSLSQAGNSLAESVALIATANTTLQNPSVVGNALKTISLRLTKTKTELEAMGEDTDFHVGVSSAYRNEILGLTGNKVDIMEGDGTTYKSTYKILEELSEVWDELSGKTQSALLYDLGGARQANTLAAILNNFDIAKDALKAAEEASGSALKENEKYLESIAGQMSILKSTMQEYSTQLLDDNVVKGILKITNAFASLATSLTSVSSAWAPLVGLLAFSRQSKGTFDVNELMSTIMPHTGWVHDNMKAIGDVLPFSKSYMANINRYNDAAVLFEKLSKSDDISAFSSSSADITKLKGLIADGDEQDIIAKQIALLADGDDLEKLTQQAQDASIAFGNMGKNMLTFKDALGASLKAMAATIVITAAIKGISLFVDTIVETTDEAQEALEETRNKISSVKDEIDQLRDIEKANSGLTSEEKARLDYLEKYQERLEAIEKIETRNLYEKKYNPKGLDYIANLFSGDKSAYNDANEWLNNPISQDGIISNAQVITAHMNSFKSAEANFNASSNDKDRARFANNVHNITDDLIADAGTLTEKITNLETENAELQQYIASGVLVGTDAIDAEDKISKNTELLQQYYDIVRKLKDLGIVELDNILPDEKELYNFANAYSFTVDAIKKANTIGTASEQLDDMQQAFETLANAHADYNKDGAYSLDTLQSLANMDSRYLKYLKQTGNQLEVVTEATDDLSNAMIVQMRISIAKNTLAEMERIAALSTAEAAEEQAASEQTLTQVLTDELNVLNAQIQLLIAKEYALNGNSAKFKLMNQAVKSHNLLMLETNDIWGKQNELQEDRQQKLEDRLKLEGDVFNDVIDKRIEALQDEIDKINELYEAEDRELELQKRKNAYMAAQANKTVRLYTHDKGWQWVADPTRVKEAKDEYEEYLREVEKEKAVEALEDQIEKYEELKDAVNDAMDHIGESLEEHNLELRLTAQFEAMAFDSMRIAAEDYKGRVIASLKPVGDELDDIIRKMNRAGVASVPPITTEDIKSKAEDIRRQDIFDGESAYYEEFGSSGNGKMGFFSDDGEDTFTLFAGDTSTGYIKNGQIWIDKNPTHISKYHSGGLVTNLTSNANVSREFVKYMNRLQSNEVPAILEADEYVLTKDMQKNILNDNQVMRDAIMRQGSYANNIAIGDVVINNPVGDVNSLSKAIVNQLPNRVLRDIYKS